jgi:hypothetical protein
MAGPPVEVIALTVLGTVRLVSPYRHCRVHAREYWTTRNSVRRSERDLAIEIEPL